jgi:hypothetical protein
MDGWMMCVCALDVNDDVVSWWFPSFDEQLDGVVRARSGLVDPAAVKSASSTSVTNNGAASTSSSPLLLSSSSSSPSFRASRFVSGGAGLWHYVLSFSVDSPHPVLARVRMASVIVLSSEYDVKRYRGLVDKLSKVRGAASVMQSVRRGV